MRNRFMVDAELNNLTTFILCALTPAYKAGLGGHLPAKNYFLRPVATFCQQDLDMHNDCFYIMICRRSTSRFMTVPLRCAIVIPVYNHGAQVRGVVEKCLQFRMPVVVVDDGSTDSTPDVLASLFGVTVIRHKKNQGKGASLLTGFSAVLQFAEWAITIDADGQHDPEDILSMTRAVPVGQRPLVIGKRADMDHKDVPWTSRWGRRFGNFWVWASCGRWLSDSQSGFRIYPLPETLHLGTKARRFQFEVEVLVRAVWRGIPIIEAPVHATYGPPGGRISHFRPWLDFWRNTQTFSRLIAMRVLIPARFRH